MVENAKRVPGIRFLCTLCDTEVPVDIGEQMEWAVAVSVPIDRNGKFKKGQAIVTTVCPKCLRRVDCEKAFLDKLRHGVFGGDLRENVHQ